MKVRYKGTDPTYPYRVVEIGYEEKEEQVLEAIASIMVDFGWKIDIVGSGYANCMVDDIDDYKSFMQDWKECKKLAKKK